MTKAPLDERLAEKVAREIYDNSSEVQDSWRDLIDASRAVIPIIERDLLREALIAVDDDMAPHNGPAVVKWIARSRGYDLD